MERIRYFILIFVVAISFIYPGASEGLTAIRKNAVLPQGIQFMSSVFDNDDSIYLLGGNVWNESVGDIFKYTISSDKIELVARLPHKIIFGSVARDKDGNIFYMGGWDWDRIGSSSDIIKFSPSTGRVENASTTTLPLPNYNSCGAKWNESSGLVYIFGGWEAPSGIVRFDMGSLVASQIASLPQQYKWPSCVSDNKGSAFLFGSGWGYIPAVKINLTTFETEYSEEILPVRYDTAAVWDGNRYAYLIGGDTEGEPPMNVIVRFNTDTMRHELLPIASHPAANASEQYRGMAAVYVPSRNGIYIFGGNIDRVYQDGIWFIDLSSVDEPTTENPTPSTSTLNPEIFTCVNKPDGMYPHPYDCAKFINCRAEELTEYVCPEPLLFDPVQLTCTLPSLANCGIECGGRPDGVYPHPYDCSLFIICASDKPQVFKCPAPLLFHPINNRCELPEFVNCLMQ